MLPTFDQIQRAAYFRWLRRGGEHGHDREDWVAAERELRFSLNYEVLVRYRLDGEPRSLGDPARRRCRFCELAAPQTTFEARALALPAFLGNTALFAHDQCEECRALFAESLEGDLEAFTRPFLAGGGRHDGNGAPRDGETGGRLEAPGRLPTAPYRPLAAFKGLTRLALAILPEAEVPYFEDTLEWVSNPDHDYDARVFEGLVCSITPLREPWPSPWAALARRTDDDATLPYLLFFLGTGRVTFQVAVPLCAKDDDLDGERMAVPRVADPAAVGQGEPTGPGAVVVLSSADVRRDVALEPESPALSMA